MNKEGRLIPEQIEDEYDLRVYKKALTDYGKNPITYTLDEVEMELFGDDK